MNLIFAFAALAAASADVPPEQPATPPAASEAPPEESPESELNRLIAAVSGKLSAGPASEETLSAELAQFDLLLTKYADRKTEAVARIHLMKALLFVEVLGDYEKGWPLLERFQQEYSHTFLAKSSLPVILQTQREMDAAGLSVLKTGTLFPTFTETDVHGERLSLEDYRGKVVLIHFWATWFEPCRDDLPHLAAAYRTFREQGFDIISISLDEDPAALAQFREQYDLGWAHFNDGRRWDNKLAQACGVTLIPGLYLLDREGRIVARRFPGKELERKLTAVLTP